MRQKLVASSQLQKLVMRSLTTFWMIVRTKLLKKVRKKLMKSLRKKLRKRCLRKKLL